MTTKQPDAKNIRAVWILRDSGEFYEYRGTPGSLNRRGKSIGFDLRSTFGDNEEFEVLLTPTKKGWQMKFETGDGMEEIAFTVFQGADETVLSHESLEQTIYLRLPTAML
jgi:hypothetical protein